jgi:hypothetical protein
MELTIKRFFQFIAVLIVLFMLVAGGCTVWNNYLRYIHQEAVEDCMDYERFTTDECEFIITTFVEGD